MTKKIVLFGATGFTGRLTAHAMKKRGLVPVLAGRDKMKLEALTSRLGGLDIRVADVSDQASVDALVEEGDVLVTTVGPFAIHGDAALLAAIKKGAHYIDSTGEPGFIRKVFQECHDWALEKNVALLTASGFDYVPGNCAAGVVLRDEGEKAVKVDVGYFSPGNFGRSQGTDASIRASLADPGMVYKSGELVEEYSGMDARAFDVGGKKMSAISVSASEHYSLPRAFPGLDEVGVYMGWFGEKTWMVQSFAKAQSVLMKVPGIKPLALFLSRRGLKSEGKGPDEKTRAKSHSHIVAEALDAKGAVLSRAEMVGVNGYDFTAAMLAWMAESARDGKIIETGAVGPVEAFGLNELIQGCGEAGMELRF